MIASPSDTPAAMKYPTPEAMRILWKQHLWIQVLLVSKYIQQIWDDFELKFPSCSTKPSSLLSWNSVISRVVIYSFVSQDSY